MMEYRTLQRTKDVNMPDITFSLDEELLDKSRKYAREHGISLNTLLRRLLEEHLRQSSSDWIDECFRLMDGACATSRDERWKREELYNG
jgi:hypothetical protein